MFRTVRNAFFNALELKKSIFYLGRINIYSSADDHIVCPADNIEISVSVYTRNISGF